MSHTLFLEKNFIHQVKERLNADMDEKLRLIHDYMTQSKLQAPPPIAYHGNYSCKVFALINQIFEAIEQDDFEQLSYWGKQLFSTPYEAEFYKLVPIQSIQDQDTQTLFLGSHSIYPEHLSREFATPHLDYDFEQLKAHFEKALALIAQLLPDFYEEMQYFIKEIYILNDRPPKQGSGIGVFGALFFSQKVLMPSIIDAYERIIHEAAHMTLYAINFTDELVLNTLEEKYHHGLREDKRPMIAVFHACFVLSRIIFGLECLMMADQNGEVVLSQEERDRAEELSGYYRNRLTCSLVPLEKAGKLTPLAQSLIAPALALNRELA